MCLEVSTWTQGQKNEFIFVKLWASGQVSVKSSFFLLSTVTQTVLDSA